MLSQKATNSDTLSPDLTVTVVSVVKKAGLGLDSSNVFQTNGILRLWH